MDIEGVLAITLIFGGGTSSSSPSVPWAGRSAERIRCAGCGADADHELLAEVDALRQEVSELHERVDFTERLLANQTERRQARGGGVRSGPDLRAIILILITSPSIGVLKDHKGPDRRSALARRISAVDGRGGRQR